MSKANRVKGTFDELMGCRMPSSTRINSLAERSQGLLDKHLPKQSKRTIPHITKAMKRALRKAARPEKECHPLARKASASERGAAKILGLISSRIDKPEVVAHG